jgi:hypothetical protein
LASITLRNVKGSALTFTEGDNNFNNLNTDKIELTDISVTSNSASGGGTLTYNNTNGTFTYTPPSLSGIGGLGDLLDDASPQLGGNLDLNNSNITGEGNIDITGTVTADDFIGPLNGQVRQTVYAAVTIAKGEVVYFSGLQGNDPIANLARSNSASTMPAMGVAAENISASSTGEITVLGPQKGLDVADFGETSITFALGDTLYISASEAGKLTNVAPAGESNLIQNIGKLSRVSPTTNCTINAGGAGRTNATPNLDQDQFFLGDANNRSVATDFSDAVEALSINNVVEDTTPQLGGNLDVNSNSIVSVSAGDIAITPDGDGKIILDGLNWPIADGTTGQVLQTNGAGQLSFATAAGGGGGSIHDIDAHILFEPGYLQTTQLDNSPESYWLYSLIADNYGSTSISMSTTYTYAVDFPAGDYRVWCEGIAFDQVSEIGVFAGGTTNWNAYKGGGTVVQRIGGVGTPDASWPVQYVEFTLSTTTALAFGYKKSNAGTVTDNYFSMRGRIQKIG